jgi:hypothetical protein
MEGPLAWITQDVLTLAMGEGNADQAMHGRAHLAHGVQFILDDL